MNSKTTQLIAVGIAVYLIIAGNPLGCAFFCSGYILNYLSRRVFCKLGPDVEKIIERIES